MSLQQDDPQSKPQTQPGTHSPHPGPDRLTTGGCPPLAPTCPTCGRPFVVPFDVPLSGLLDLALQAKEAVCALQAALEEEALP